MARTLSIYRSTRSSGSAGVMAATLLVATASFVYPQARIAVLEQGGHGLAGSAVTLLRGYAVHARHLAASWGTGLPIGGLPTATAVPGVDRLEAGRAQLGAVGDGASLWPSVNDAS